MNWISVKERLPELDQRVLACDVDGNIEFALMTTYSFLNGRQLQWVYTNYIPWTNILYWMPLPNLMEQQEPISWFSLRIKYPLQENIEYHVKDCRWNVIGKALYNGYDFIQEEWEIPMKGSLFLSTYHVTHWKPI